MQVSSFVAESECGSDDLAPSDMARHSQALRLAYRSMTRLRLSFPCGDARRHILVVHKDWEYDGVVLEKTSVIVGVLKSVSPQSIVTIYSNGERVPENVDLVVTVGGDGTVLQAAWLFQSVVVPPVCSFALGTLGFLTNFQVSEDPLELRDTVNFVLSSHGGVERPRILLRMRLTCRFPGDDTPEYTVLNDVTVERSVAGMLTVLDVIVGGRVLTTVAADGLIIATPTGSTAYNLSAGGSVVHPDVPCILLTPVSPHSLSFRPVLLPDTSIIEIRVNKRSRSPASVCLDGGRGRRELLVGESIVVSASPYPVPTVCRRDQSDDWFEGLTTCFRWATR